jgi:hypothetical protein
MLYNSNNNFSFSFNRKLKCNHQSSRKIVNQILSLNIYPNKNKSFLGFSNLIIK